MRRNIWAGTLVVASVLAAASAFAGDSTLTGVSLRAGVFMPTTNPGKVAGDDWFAFGADYRLNDLGVKAASGYKANLSISLDYFGKSNFSNVPLLLNYIGHVGPAFYEVGGGVGFTRLPSGTTTDSKTKLAYGVGIGYELNQLSSTPFFVEAKFFGSAESSLNGAAVYVGIRL